MKRIFFATVASLVLVACSEWTEIESKATEFENIAIQDLIAKRDGFKWQAEAERIKENNLVRKQYFADLRAYKEKAWRNTGTQGGQTPMFYFWYSSDAWKAIDGMPKSWLQSLPDSLTAISMWGGLAIHPEDLTPNMKKDLEVFHEKGSIVLMCWQTSAPGLGIIGSKDKTVNGWTHFRNKYPYDEVEKDDHRWAGIYARDLARYIIALGFDGYDVDWETCGDHGAVTPEGHSFMIVNGYDGTRYANIRDFVLELAKYFGPVGEDHYVKTQAEREANLTALFDASTPDFHPNESEFINDFMPHLPQNWKTKRYYLAADIPCGVAPIFATATFSLYFDKHYLQDYTVSGVGSHIQKLGGIYFNSTSANYQAGGYAVIPNKARAVRARQIWGFGAYHGQTDYDNTHETASFQTYLRSNNIKRKYKTYAWTREAIRIADPRTDGEYGAYNEDVYNYIITP